ncbi:MAG: hypothetical protein HUK21_03390 [Fibrobacteraceae bacterium]|nr:hypothetical protein [Fibrobacteraceae bacterium]
MKRILGLIFICTAMAFAGSAAQTKQMAVGGWLQAGNPGEHAGLDFEMRQGSTNTLDIYAHFYFSDGDNSLGAYFGYYWDFYLNGLPGDIGRMGFYAGPTAGVGLWNVGDDNWDETGLAIRGGVVGGFEWEFPVIPLQLYLELSPVGEFKYFWWEDEKDDLDGDDSDWQLPDLYFRIGLRFWF